MDCAGLIAGFQRLFARSIKDKGSDQVEPDLKLSALHSGTCENLVDVFRKMAAKAGTRRPPNVARPSAIAPLPANGFS